MRPTPEQVIQKLEELVATEESKDASGLRFNPKEEKLYGRLRAVSDDGTCCYCVEGLLCEAAIQLGMDAWWVVRGETIDIEVENDSATASAPTAVYEFLGIPKEVDVKRHRKSIEKLIETYKERRYKAFNNTTSVLIQSHNDRLYRATQGASEVRWWRLNDSTNVPLSELVKLVIKVLKDNS